MAVHVAFLVSLSLGHAIDHPRGNKGTPPPADPSAFHRYGFLNDLFNDAAPYMYGQGADFFIVLSAGRYLLEGKNMYDLRPHKSVPYAYIPYPYFPTVAWLEGHAFRAFTAWQAYWTWVALDELLLVANLLLARRMARRLAPAAFPWVAGMWLAFFPYYVEVFMGQMNFPMTTCLHAFLVAALERRPVAMTLAWTAGFLAKMMPVLLLPALARFRRFGVLASGLFLAALPLAPHLLDTSRTREVKLPAWLARTGISAVPVPEGIHQITSHLGSAAVPGPYAGTPSFGGLLRTITSSPGLQKAIRMAFLVIALGLLFAAGDLAHASGLLIAAYFLAYSHPWEHHFVIALPAIGLLYLQGGGLSVVAFLAWALMALPTPYVLYGERFIESPAYYAPKAAGSLLLYGGYAALVLRRRPPEERVKAA